IESIGLGCLSVSMQVNEARGDDEAPPACVDRVAAAYGVRRDDSDSSALEPDIADRIELGGRIHDASAENHAVVDRVRSRRRQRGHLSYEQQAEVRGGCDLAVWHEGGE